MYLPFLPFYSLSHGLSFFQEGKVSGKDNFKLDTNAESSKVFIYSFTYITFEQSLKIWTFK